MGGGGWGWGWGWGVGGGGGEGGGGGWGGGVGGQCNDRPLGKHFGVILGLQAGKQSGFWLFCQKFPLNLHQACSTCRLD